jgi:hypothetical protein
MLNLYSYTFHISGLVVKNSMSLSSISISYFLCCISEMLLLIINFSKFTSDTVAGPLNQLLLYHTDPVAVRPSPTSFLVNIIYQVLLPLLTLEVICCIAGIKFYHIVLIFPQYFAYTCGMSFPIPFHNYIQAVYFSFHHLII